MTEGFYKLENDNLLYGQYITIPDHPAEDIGMIMLTLENHEDFTYPILGWYYFDSEENAKEFFGIQ